MFSRDIRHARPTPRTVQQAFGPYHRVNIPTRRSKVVAALWMVGYGVLVGLVWYLITAFKAGAL